MFAARTKRLENWTFQSMYQLYRLLHWLLTGVSVRIGNFSVLRPATLPRLLMVSELWNHYAAAVFRSKVPLFTLPIARGKRYCGRSQMNFPGLVMHGLSAMSVFSDIIGVRLLVATIALLILAGVSVGSLLAISFATSLVIPAWATNGVGLLVGDFAQSLLRRLVLAFITLSMRSHANVIPLRDAGVFVGNVETLVTSCDTRALSMPLL
jgi:hypothetical protein